MPILYVETYPLKLLQLNPQLQCVYVESHEKRGGDPATVQVRGIENSLPLTVRNNYDETGYLIADTEARDIPLIESQIRTILFRLRMGITVCLPTLRLSEELNYLEKHTPKVEQYLLKRLRMIKDGFPLQE
jgi:hypothetical protein